MDLSDLVHGLKPKSERSLERIGGSPGRSSSGNRSSQESSSKASGGGQGRNEKSKQESGGRGRESLSASSSLEDPTAQLVGSASGDKVALSCDLCNRMFESKTKFDQHCAVFHGRSKGVSKPREASYPCPFCGKAFTSPSKMNVHKNATHMGLRPFQCTLCDKSFGYRGDLTKHMTTHSGEKRHSCYICGAKFARNFYVKRHIETVHERKSSHQK